MRERRRQELPTPEVCLGNETPSLVGIHAGVEGHDAEGDGHVFVADALFMRLRMRIERADADVDAVDVARVADAASKT